MRAVQFTVLAALAQLSVATYDLGRDPSNGYVDYQSKSAAFQANLVKKLGNSVRIGSDSKGAVTNLGRKSVRVETKANFKHGLIVADIKHMPGSICGVWPAFWTVGSRWPEDGEFDIIEGINRQSVNKMALHTTKGCKIKRQGDFSGVVETPDCDVNSPTQAANQGCLITARHGGSYGTDFNKNNGGVYALEWTSSEITVWFFPRGSIPSDVKSSHPNPKGWGKPMARFSGDCDLDKFVQKQRILYGMKVYKKGLQVSSSSAQSTRTTQTTTTTPTQSATETTKGSQTATNSASTNSASASQTQSSSASESSDNSTANPTGTATEPSDSATNSGVTPTGTATASTTDCEEPTETPQPCDGEKCPPGNPSGTDGTKPSDTGAPCDGTNCPGSPTATTGGTSPTDTPCNGPSCPNEPPCDGEDCPGAPSNTDGGASPTDTPCNGPGCPNEPPCDGEDCPGSPTKTDGGASPTGGNGNPGEPGTTDGNTLPTNTPEVPPGCTPRTTCVTYTSIETITIINTHPSASQTGIQLPPTYNDDDVIIPLN
ncbi:predicted protein [Uncinocarpus reesii 1704]|uniref:GH16 domain-containing protein n=1 Tax=Uncinocarpus reesii (strain UAMH 1704) TaxID=336963 RepID=C4JVU9_UNCRE|nr:uncharacterized protein UREG_06691 [Uncinocarpus reesii 1704]EEP81826.1 predicted protein [Uncinocarpus reesii 1704]